MPESAAANRIFISCVSDEFQKPAARFPGLRADLRHYLTRADCEVKVQEDFRQTEVDTLEKLNGYIRNCAAVVHLVGEMPGAVAHAEAVRAYLDRRAAQSKPRSGAWSVGRGGRHAERSEAESPSRRSARRSGK